MFCAFPRPRYQVSVYRTNGPLVTGSVCAKAHQKLSILVTEMYKYNISI